MAAVARAARGALSRPATAARAAGGAGAARRARARAAAEAGDVKMTLEKPLGLVLEQLTDGRVVVSEVQQNSNAAASGMVRLGDQIVAVGEQSVEADAVPPEAVERATYLDWTLQFISQQPPKDCRITVRRADGVGVTMWIEGAAGADDVQIQGMAPGVDVRTYMEAQPSLAEHTGVTFMCGRASCGTCACDVLEGEELLSVADDGEEDTLFSIGAGPDARLMCNLSAVATSGTVRVRKAERSK